MPTAPYNKKPFFLVQTPVPMCMLMSPNLMIGISSALALPTNIVTGGRGGLDVSMFADARGRPRMNCTWIQECQGKRQRRPARSGKSKITYLQRVPPSYLKSSIVLLAFLLASPPGVSSQVHVFGGGECIPPWACIW